jgi:hypothetical protein
VSKVENVWSAALFIELALEETAWQQHTDQPTRLDPIIRLKK